jgi:SH3-like domain-containing protein
MAEGQPQQIVSGLTINAAALVAAFLLVMPMQATAQAPVVERPVPTTPGNQTAPSAGPRPPVTPAVAAPATPAATPSAGTGVATPAAAAPTATAPTNGTATPPPATKSFVSVGDRPTVLYDAPSNRSNRTFIVLRNTPLEVLVKLDRWTKVRDADNTIGWVENSALGDRRFVQVSAATAEVRASAASTAALVFEAQRQVLLEVTGAATEGWIPVRHRDGQVGFIRTTQVWGD